MVPSDLHVSRHVPHVRAKLFLAWQGHDSFLGQRPPFHARVQHRSRIFPFERNIVRVWSSVQVQFYGGLYPGLFTGGWLFPWDLERFPGDLLYAGSHLTRGLYIPESSIFSGNYFPRYFSVGILGTFSRLGDFFRLVTVFRGWLFSWGGSWLVILGFWCLWFE